MLPAMPVIYVWGLVVLVLFKRYSTPVALCCAILGGYLLLPHKVGLDLPFFPALNKDTVPAFAAVLAVLIFARQRKTGYNAPASPVIAMPGILPRDRTILCFLIALFVSFPLTTLNNGTRLVYGATVLSGMQLFDIFAATLTLIVSLIPFLLARKYLATAQTHKILLTSLCLAGFAYSFLVLYEVRMSPQINNFVYGFFPSSWRQHLRGDGFRPIVFLKHGLWLGIFISGTVLAAIIMGRISETRRKLMFAGIAGWLLITLILAKTFGAVLITFALLPAALLLRPRLQIIFAAAVAATVLFYPMLRGTGLIPLNGIVNFAASIDPERASSLNFRLNNEEILLEKANQRPFFGWGSWGRARVYKEGGGKGSTTDGLWVITIGEAGWFGYISRFGILAVPIFLLALRSRRYPVGLETSGLCLIMAGNMVELIPNAGWTVITWLVAGALVGRLETQADAHETHQPQDNDTSDTRAPRYSRKPPQPGQRAGPSYARRTASRASFSRPDI